MSHGRWLLMRGHDILWAVSSDRVRSVEGASAGVRVHLERHVLAADSVLAAAIELVVAGNGAVARCMLPPGCLGLALHPAGPVLLVDAEAPPASLLSMATVSRMEEEGDNGVRGE